MATPVDDITIPDEALEEAAKELYEQERDLGGRSLPSWSEAGRKAKERFYKAARAACLAMLRAWPGMRDSHHVSFDGRAENSIVLPLPQEPRHDT